MRGDGHDMAESMADDKLQMGRLCDVHFGILYFLDLDRLSEVLT